MNFLIDLFTILKRGGSVPAGVYFYEYVFTIAFCLFTESLMGTNNFQR